MAELSIKNRALQKLFRFSAAALVAAPLTVSAVFAGAANDNAAAGSAPDQAVKQALLSSSSLSLSLSDTGAVLALSDHNKAARGQTPARHAMTASGGVSGGLPAPHNILSGGATPLTAGLSMGPVAFAAPWALVGLAALPLLWRLMKTTPPRPRREKFPPMHIISRISSKDRTPDKMPLWHRQMRIAMAAAAVIGLAQPEWNPETALDSEEGPVRLLVDNGPAAARHWEDRVRTMNRLIDRADRENRLVMLLPMAPSGDGSPVTLSGPMAPEEARKKVGELAPQSWPVDRQAARGALEAVEPAGNASVFWISNGLDDGHAEALVEKLADYGHVTIFEDESHNTVRLLRPPEIEDDRMTVTVERPEAGIKESMTVTASDETGYPVAQTGVVFDEGETEATATLDVPPEIRNRMARLSIDGENSAYGVVLLDERWRRRPVGLIDAGTSSAGTADPLLDQSHYIESALGRDADVRHGTVDDLMERRLSVMVMTDDVSLTEEEREKITEWIRQGGTLLRFAGPRLAAQPDQDDLVPVPLRPDIRHINEGGLSGRNRAGLAPFEQDSPFYGLQVPADVKITRSIMTEPGSEIEAQTWARLQDGTPFVTARRQGEGQVVLMHGPGNTGWSNLPLSGLFADMMKAVVSHSHGVNGVTQSADVTLPPYRALDGHGRLVNPPPSARPLGRDVIETGAVSAVHPPGYYGTENARYAHNLAAGVGELKALPDEWPQSVTQDIYRQEEDRNTGLAGPLLAGAFAVFLVDWLLRLGQQGRLPSSSSFRKKRPEDSKIVAGRRPDGMKP